MGRKQADLMAALPTTEEGILRRGHPTPSEDDAFHTYGSSAGRITDETEYVRKIRTTLEKIQSQLFKDDINGKTLHSKHEQNSPNSLQNVDEESSFSSRYKQIVERLKDEDLQLAETNKQNEDLQIKLEATREAGSSALRDATRKLYENYGKKAEQLRKSHLEEKQALEASAVEHQRTLNNSVDKLHEVAEKIQEKHGRILELENLMRRMEEEKTVLLAKKQWLENEISRRMSHPAGMNGCVNVQTEISTTQEQITHLQNLMMSQHQSLRTLIQEREDLKNRLKEQDDTIVDLKERISMLECQNKELKYKMEHSMSPAKPKVSKAISVNESMLDKMSPYFMLRNLTRQNGTERS
ncbi:coiled-coil domain-containing protein 68 [Spea bombifrons]|uniref:coiled-coil domain-containing protein 68 n=1 Tax=Spea bombifrons TaxID=233779 RepID=UPI0023496126|nr:coiled-coil domain-containing protein 68 [Spea bombifrons]